MEEHHMKTTHLRTVQRFAILFGITILLLSVMMSETTYAASYTQNFTFETSDQSMWTSGPAVTAEITEFLGFEWNESGSAGGFVGGVTTIIPAGCLPWWLGGGCWDEVTGDTTTGAEISGNTDGKVGLEFGLTLDSGSVDVFYPIQVNFEYPEEVDPGELFTLSTSYTVDPSAFFSTSSPTFQVYTDLIFDFYAALSAEACLLGGCTTGSLPTVDIDASLELFALNRDNDAQVRILGDLPGGVSVGGEIPIPGGFGEVTYTVPDVQTTSGSPVGDTLSSSGSDEFLEIGVDIDQIATSLLGLPALEGEVGIFSYNILDVTMGPALEMIQNFFFDPEFLVGLDLGDGTTTSFRLGESIDLVMPDRDLTLTPTFSLTNSFTNDTDLGIGLNGSLEALSASLSVLGQEASIGPLFEQSFSTGSLFDFSVFTNTFALGGFESFTTEAFIVQATVPEPGTLILVGVGIVGIGVLRHRKKKS
jgi:hypothetical protein